MLLCSLAVGGRVTIGIETAEGFLDGSALIRDTLQADAPTLTEAIVGGLLDAGPLDTIRAAVEAPRPEWQLTGSAVLLPPVESSAKIICIGRNYKAHAAERQKPWPESPVFWQKPGSALLAHGGEIVIPAWAPPPIDHEAELGVVIGSRAKNVQPGKAWAYVAGFTVVNDVTARTVQDDDIKQGWPWFRGKGMDTFCPMGPGIVPRADLPDPAALTVTCRVNGEARQHGVVSDMRFGIPELIASVSRYVTLEPGDVISTGTPGGVGSFVAGDLVECEVSGIGVLRNRAVQR
jgi:2,4-didehydro-3-deoxy-L-rhamnonate hydrolase